MNRFIVRIAPPLLFLWAGVSAAAQPKLAFEVVSIKPVPRPTPETVRDGTSRIGTTITSDRVEIAGMAPASLVAMAFQVANAQVDATAVAAEQSFEIQAKLPAGATREQVPEMLQTMLTERFKLAYHRETRGYTVTVITIGRGGMKLQRLADGTLQTSGTKDLGDGGTRFTQIGPVKSLFLVMGSFGGFSQPVDETGLDGLYTWVRDLPALTAGQRYQDAVQDSYRVMLDAAGLRLESRKISKETIIIDHLEKMPTEN